MRRRLFLFFLPSFMQLPVFANEALWNCAQNKDTKEWVCVGEKKPADKTSEVKPPVSTESVKEAQPEPAEAVESAQPVVAEPVQVVQPIIPAREQATETVESSRTGRD